MMGMMPAATRNIAIAPFCENNIEASVTPSDCPKKKAEAKSETAVPLTWGTICVALVCSVLCSM